MVVTKIADRDMDREGQANEVSDGNKELTGNQSKGHICYALAKSLAALSPGNRDLQIFELKSDALGCLVEKISKKQSIQEACSDYPAGWDTWRPNRDLETRDSMRKRTPKDGRPLTKTKGVKLFRSPREPAASGSKKMKPNMKFLWRIIALYNIVTVYAGFGDPRKARELLRKQYGQPCDCRGGQISEPPSDRITQVTCTGKTAYLMPNQLWKCKSTPRDTSPSGPLLECPCSSFQSSVHSSCYTSYQQCKSGNRTYYTATLLKTQTGGINDVQVLGSTNKLVQSPCNGQKGKPVCWSTTAPFTFLMEEAH
ncbi:uncharacterized protein LOC144333269 [Macaca mulatta]